MRVISLCLLSLLLTGCSLLHKPRQPENGASPETVKNAPVKKPAPSRPAVTIYTDTTDLLSQPFRDLGEVSGEDCQTSTQDSPASLSTARKRMQARASAKKANAVLLHQCEIITSAPGCYKQAVCQGSALKVTTK